MSNIIAIHILMDGEVINIWEFEEKYSIVYEDIIALVQANEWDR